MHSDERDVVRHRLVQEIIKAYDRQPQAGTSGLTEKKANI